MQRRFSWPTFEEPNSPITIGELSNKQIPFDNGQKESINSQWSLAKYENSERFRANLRAIMHDRLDNQLSFASKYLEVLSRKTMFANYECGC